MRIRAMKKQSQNKPNFRKAQMNVNSFITKDYRKKDDFAVQKNKPKQSQFQKSPNECQSFYEPIYLILWGTSRPCSVISFESDIIFLAPPSAIMRPLSSRTALSASAAAKFISQVAIIRV